MRRINGNVFASVGTVNLSVTFCLLCEQKNRAAKVAVMFGYPVFYDVY